MRNIFHAQLMRSQCYNMKWGHVLNISHPSRHLAICKLTGSSFWHRYLAYEIWRNQSIARRQFPIISFPSAFLVCHAPFVSFSRFSACKGTKDSIWRHRRKDWTRFSISYITRFGCIPNCCEVRSTLLICNGGQLLLAVEGEIEKNDVFFRFLDPNFDVRDLMELLACLLLLGSYNGFSVGLSFGWEITFETKFC